jgi:hypothetical protein
LAQSVQYPIEKYKGYPSIGQPVFEKRKDKRVEMEKRTKNYGAPVHDHEPGLFMTMNQAC